MMQFKVLAAVRRTRGKLTALDFKSDASLQKQSLAKFQEACVYEQEAPGKTQTQKGNLQRIETGIILETWKIWVRKPTAMIELNLGRDIKNNKKNSYRYAGGKMKNRGNGGSTQEGNWRPDYLGYEED